MSRTVTIWVPGKPATKGSWRSIGKGRLAPDNKRLKTWTQSARLEATRAWDRPLTYDAVSLEIVYFLKRPQSHYRTSGGEPTTRLKANAPEYPLVEPDGDKMERAVLDALTGVVYDDDKQVRQMAWWKRYANPHEACGHDEGVSIQVSIWE